MNYEGVKDSFYILLSDTIRWVRYKAEQKGDLKQIYALSNMVETIPGLLRDWKYLLDSEPERANFLISTIYSRVADYELRFPADKKRFSSTLISMK
ncbi:hypothetical protein HOO68_03735 [Candidatus Gracilibacteria bacterium]|nr:hypothetical protein [Candidatus Gracilibacteria bacterium]